MFKEDFVCHLQIPKKFLIELPSLFLIKKRFFFDSVVMVSVRLFGLMPYQPLMVI